MSARPATVTRFTQDLDAVLASARDTVESAESVRRYLGERLAEKKFLPEEFLRPVPEGYARRLLHRNDETGHVAVVMVWGPGQGTPIHDHGGIWCVEGVYEGLIEVTRYDITGPVTGGRVPMRVVEVLHSGIGQCGALIPPVEFHRIRNSASERAITVHVYGQELTRCRTFEPTPEGDYIVRHRVLSYSEF
jgi:predicted metal-dependent enzyme (double-stranded beta helix superfamily)